jgi:hypothetical protein
MVVDQILERRALPLLQERKDQPWEPTHLKMPKRRKRVPARQDKSLGGSPLSFEQRM